MKRLLAAASVGLSAALMLASAAPAAAAPGAPSAPEYYFDQWHVPQLWAQGARGQGITIGEIDTGVAADQPIFTGRVLSGKDFGRLGGDGRIDRDKDAYGHGTSMASIMVGRPGLFGIRGLAPDATVLPIAIPLTGTTDAAGDDHLPEAITWAADHGAKIISMSLGGVRRPVQNSTACPQDEQQAIFHALRKGALVFAASGNRGQYGSPVEEPGVCIGVVSVGAVDSAGHVAEFSSRHSYLTLSAPGVNIPSIGPGGAGFSGDGTSQATAIASAVAALVWSRYPSLSAPEVLSRMLATLDGRTGKRSPAYGFGIVNAGNAVTAQLPVDATNPVYAVAAPFLADGSPSSTAPLGTAKPIARAAHPPGRYAVGVPPRQLGSQVVVGLAIAAAGLLLLLVLLVVGRSAVRRRRAAAVVPVWTPPVAPGEVPLQRPLPPPPLPSERSPWAPP